MFVYTSTMRCVIVAVFLILVIIIVLGIRHKCKQSDDDNNRTHCDFNAEEELPTEPIGCAEAGVTPTGTINPPAALFGASRENSGVSERENGAQDINRLLYEETMGLDLSYDAKEDQPTVDFGPQGYTFINRSTENMFNEMEEGGY